MFSLLLLFLFSGLEYLIVFFICYFLFLFYFSFKELIHLLQHFFFVFFLIVLKDVITSFLKTYNIFIAVVQ